MSPEPFAASLNEPGVPSDRRALRFLPGLLIVLAALLPGSSPYIGDTMSYASSVVAHYAGDTERGFRPLWEFGHLLWRPLGALVAPLTSSLVPDTWTVDPRVKIAYGFLAVSILAALGTGILAYDLVRRLAGWRAAAILTFGLSWTNGFLMYALSGCSYVPALFFGVAALWVLLGDPGAWRRQVIAGIAGAISVSLWFPFILTAPALAIVPWAWLRLPRRVGFEAALRIGMTTAGVVVAVYAVGAASAGVRTPAEFLAWYADASHGWVQTQQWKRAVTGVARLMLDLSRDGIALKRFALGDPYQSLSLWDLVRQSLWKLAAFYLSVGAILWMGGRTRLGRAALAIGLVAAVPMLYFALVLLEPSSPERFLPMVPFVLLAAAAGWHGAGRWIVTAFIAALPVLNGPAFIERWSPAVRETAEQMSDVTRHLAPDDLLVTITFADPMAQWMEQRVFHPSLSRGRFPTYQLIATAEVTAARWRQRFADRALRHWESGAQVWLRRGALADRPEPVLRWVEGDHPDIRWPDVITFLRQLEYDGSTDRPDGFVRVAPTARSRAVLEAARADSVGR